MIITKKNQKVTSKYLVPSSSQVMAEVENFENKSSEALISISGDLNLEVADKHDFIIFKKYPNLLEGIEDNISGELDAMLVENNYDQIIGIIRNPNNGFLNAIIRLDSTDYDTITSQIDWYRSSYTALDVPEIRINDLITKAKTLSLNIISADKWDLQGNEYLPEINTSKLKLLMQYIPVPVLCKELYKYGNLQAVHTVVVTPHNDDDDGEYDFLRYTCTNLRVFYHINFKTEEGKAKQIRLDKFAGCDLGNIPASYFLKIKALTSSRTDEFILEEPEFCEEENYIPIINAIIEAKASYVNCYEPFFACLLQKVPAELMEKLLENTTIYLDKNHELEKTNNN